MPSRCVLTVGCQNSLDLIWSLVGHLESGGPHANSRVGRLLRRESELNSVLSMPPASTVRLFPGKGVEGPAPQGIDTSCTETRRGVAAVGSLDFVLACHQFGIEKSGVAREGKAEWRSLQCWAEQRLNDGEDVIVVAYNGLPLAAVVIHTDYGCFWKSSFDYIEVGEQVLTSQFSIRRSGVFLVRFGSVLAPVSFLPDPCHLELEFHLTESFPELLHRTR